MDSTLEITTNAVPENTTLEVKKPPLRIQICLFSYGGVFPMTHACLERDVITAIMDPDQSYAISMSQFFNDALIDRCRAIAAEQFLKTNNDIMIMIDHDLEWDQGSILRLARKAAETGGIVGAAVTKRSKGGGIASCIADVGVWQVGIDRCVEARYIGAAMTAYPRKIIEKVAETFPLTVQGFRPMFLPCTWPHPHDPQKTDYLSEDWAFCRRALELGFKCYIDLKPNVLHHGTYAYGVKDAFDGANPGAFQIPPKFTLLHATRGRPAQAIATHNKWREMASGLHEIEYIMSCDNDDPNPLPNDGMPDGTRIIYGENRGCCDAYNRAAYDASGDILIQVHDDLECHLNWDELITKKLDYTKEQVLKVSDGTNVNPEKPDMLTVLIGTKKYFQKIGYFWHPKFISVFCDDHLTAKAKKDNAIVDGTDLIFRHNWKGQDADQTYRHSYTKENWEHGEKALKELIDSGLNDEPDLWGKL